MTDYSALGYLQPLGVPRSPDQIGDELLCQAATMLQARQPLSRDQGQRLRAYFAYSVAAPGNWRIYHSAEIRDRQRRRVLELLGSLNESADLRAWLDRACVYNINPLQPLT